MRISRLCLILGLITSLSTQAETLLFKQEVGLCAPLSIPIPSGCITDADVKSGELTLYLTAHNQRAGWTIHCTPGLLYLTDGKNTYPLRNAPHSGDNLGGIPSGVPRRLVFKLPPSAQRHGLSLKITRGLFSMLAQPEGPYTLEVWKGLRPKISSYVDRMNRGVMINAGSVGEEGVRFVYEIPGFMRKESTVPYCFFRLPENGKPFQVNIEIQTRKDGVVKSVLNITPHAIPTAAPMPQETVLTGICYYENSLDQYDKFIAEDLGNLLVQWTDQDSVEKKRPYLKRLADRNICYMGIYRYDSKRTIASYKEIFGRNYLHNNIGEYAGYLYQGIGSAEAIHMPTDQHDMQNARDRFLEFINGRVREDHKRHDYLLSTSGSALADYELMGGMDFMCSELYAVGANNINYAIAEMRGAARRWKPEFWGGWLAEEWQTFNVPYQASQKYDMLTVGLYANYMMGTNIIVLESGASTTQAQKYTRDLNGKVGCPQEFYNGKIPKQYRKTMHDFWQFVKANPRDRGTPETHIALLRGNLDSWIGAFHSWIPAWAQHKTARQQPQWLMGDPERTWLAAMDVFTPIFADALKPYANYWIGGMPYGQMDVVGLDEFSRLSDLCRYQLAVIPGWNTMTPELMKTLSDYVEQGGILVISLPQFLTRRDREATRYEIADLIGGGDLSDLINVKVTSFTEASGSLTFPTPGKLKKGIFHKEQLAIAGFGDNVEVLAAIGKKPYVVQQSRGKGKVVLLLGKEYPGKESTAHFYKSLLHTLAGEVEQSVAISPVPDRKDDVRAISFAVYPSKIYFLNADCVSSRTVNATIDGRRQKLTLAPHEFRIVERKK